MTNISIYATMAMVLGLSFNGENLSAQIQDSLTTPAEFPPASYTGRQYVDSRGCVYIRAGIDGNVTWVPRVARNRKVVCGFNPSLDEGTRTVAAPVPDKAPDSAPEVIAIAPETPAAAKPATPKPATVASPVAPVQPPVVRQPAPPPVVAEKPAPAPHAEPIAKIPAETRVVRTAKGKKKVRIPSTKVYSGKSGATQVTNRTVIAPKTAYERGSGTRVPVPEGYKPAWDDQRLSTTRANQTLDGRRRMLLTWTNTVPRQLIDKYTGEEVSAYLPDLQYPYTTMRQQRAAGVVSSRGQQPVAAPKRRVVKKRLPASALQPASHRYIQVGSFTSQPLAQDAILRLQSAGLPVRVNEYTQDGVGYRMVLVGPFQRQDQLNSAWDIVRHRIGYQSAALRK